ncbi:molybdate ABC transporter substrate-binding protein [Microbulbifer celer]|uniref:Molybdate ABC transporter substrate-binding protein n=1 Tax=Microbulbifer celer TaxID=435905 RepID=A0ABW3UAZ2_9GAMM|nr:molybdate ABC transporter substrate-binding protein [Microbulbifer celer]UFN58827.1 molybdate ABC transporter substrate-binding protein [Microbulbifer celer]
MTVSVVLDTPGVSAGRKYARHFLATLLTMSGFSIAISVSAEELMIAVASNFTAPMREIAQSFEDQSTHKVHLAFGSSGKLYAQINHGAPFQAFFSADQEKPFRLVEEGLADAKSRFTYAQGKLVLWSRKPGFVDNQGKVLAGDDYNKLAIANPKLAPYGAAAVQVLESLNLVQTSRARWVQGENIAQTYQFVATGNADLGLVAQSQITRDGQTSRGSAWLVPEDLYAPVRQDAVQLTNSPAMDAFWQYMKGPEAQAIIRRFGYDVSTHRATIEPE